MNKKTKIRDLFESPEKFLPTRVQMQELESINGKWFTNGTIRIFVKFISGKPYVLETGKDSFLENILRSNEPAKELAEFFKRL